MKTLSDWIVAAFIIFVLVNTLISGKVFDTLGWLALGFVLRFLWDNRRENMLDWS